jgi:hypothetical protein
MSTPNLAMIPCGYKDSKLYSILPTDGDGDFTVARASKKHSINSDLKLEIVNNNIPSFNYGSVDGCPMLSVEPQSTNLITYPVSFDDAYWTKDGTTIDDNSGAGYSAPSVDFSTSAFKLIEGVSNSYHSIYVSLGVLSSSKYTFHAFVKKGERYKMALSDRNTGAYASFNLEDGTLIEQLSMTSTIKSFNDDWYMLSITSTSAVTAFVPQILILDDSYTTGVPILATYMGDGTSGIYIFMAQIEAREGATSPTFTDTTLASEGSTTTRLADIITGGGDATTFNDDEGVLYYNGISHANDSTFKILSLSDGTTSNRIWIYYSVDSNVILGYDGTTTISYAVNTLTPLKAAIVYDSNGIRMWVNGVQVGSNSFVGFSGFDRINFTDEVGALPMNADVKSVVYYNYALADSELATLTTL